MKYKNELILSWEEVHKEALELAEIISLSEIKYDGIIAITKGGLFPALIVSTFLRIDYIDTICIRSYKKKKQKETKLIKSPIGKMNISKWLIIDDLTDTGETIEMTKSFFGTYSTVDVGVLYTKPKGHHTVDYSIKKFFQDTWIVFPWEKNIHLNKGGLQ